MNNGRTLVLGLILLPCLAASGCKSKTELTCRWVAVAATEENLKGPDPVIALTAPWTELGVETDKATVCKSTPNDLSVLYKDRGDGFEAFADFQKTLEGKGYQLTKFESVREAGMVSATLERASDKSSLHVRMNSWPKDVWKNKPYDLSVSRSTMRTP